MKKRPKIRPATKEDMESFYPGFKWTFRAYVAEIEDRIIGIGGIYYVPPYVIAFSTFKPEMDEYPMTKLRGMKKIMEIVKDRTCLAAADKNFPGSSKLLERLGFEHIEGRIYRWTPSQE